MGKRLSGKQNEPTRETIEKFIGVKAVDLLNKFEVELTNLYDLKRDLRHPFGDKNGWGYKYAHKNSHLCYIFFLENGIEMTTQLGDKTVKRVEELLPNLLPKTQKIWENRYPCGEQGGWVHYEIENEAELGDAVSLVKCKQNPPKK